MSGYNESATFDRDDDALVPEQPAQQPGTGADTAGVAPAARTSAGEDTTVGATDDADAEFAASAAEADSGADVSTPSEPDDRFDDDAKQASIEKEDIGTPSVMQPGTQGEDPIYAELGDEGQGDLAPEDQL